MLTTYTTPRSKPFEYIGYQQVYISHFLSLHVETCVPTNYKELKQVNSFEY